MDDPREYRLLPDRLPLANRLAIRRYLAPQFAILTAVVIISFFLAVHNAETGGVVGFSVILALFLTYIFFWGPRRILRRQAKCWETYVLTIGADYLIRQQAGTPEIRLPFSDVKRIEHLPGRYLRVVGRERYQVIGIPESIENFEEVLQAVSRIAPPRNLTRDRSLKNAVLLAGGFLAYMVMLWTDSPRVVLPLALAVSAVLIWLFVYIQKSPNVTRGSKRISWLYLVFVTLCALKALSALGKMGSH
jgi:hypothetical protein